MNFLVKKMQCNISLFLYCDIFIQSVENYCGFFFHMLKAAFETSAYIMITGSDTLFMSTDLMYMIKCLELASACYYYCIHSP